MHIIHKPLRAIFAILLAATAVIRPLYATPAVSTSETPLKIYDIAVKNDPSFGAAISEHAISKEKTNQVRGALYPEVNLTAEIARNREDVETNGIGISGLNYFDSNNLEVEVKQALYRQDIFSKIDIADAESLAADNAYKLARQDLIMRTIQTYFDVLSAQDNMRFATAEKETISRQLQNIKQRFKVGKSTKTDLQEAQASYHLSVAQAIISQDMNQDALEGLTELTGFK
ncbi:MAG: TolC family protein, partial [Gammaproteobacteria bacterium]|nr:TolC family protein [Gammaproteobacteria bacterium]